MVSCFKRIAGLSLLALTLSCGQDGVAPIIGSGPKKGIVTTWAGTANSHGNLQGPRLSSKFYGPSGIASDGTYLYICETYNDLITRVNISTGVVDVLAGSGVSGGNDGIGTSAEFYWPYSIALHQGKLYVYEIVDNNGFPAPRLRVINLATKAVTTVTTGIGSIGMHGLASDGTNLYIANGNKVSKVNTTAYALTDVSTGFASVRGLTYGGGYLWVADDTNAVIYRVSPSDGTKTVVAGSISVYGNTDGPATTTARFASMGQLLYLNGVLYIYDAYRIRALNIAISTVTTLAGQYSTLGYADGSGTAVKFNAEKGTMATDGKNLFFGDMNNEVIRKID